MKNYRPVSNLIYISKLIEREIVANSTNTYLGIIFSNLSNRYIVEDSSETALVKVQNEILLATDDDVTMLLLDLSAAYDTVSLLINRIEKRLGTKGKAFDWLKSYIENRQQCVNINNTKSKSCLKVRCSSRFGYCTNSNSTVYT